jgi:hypothetical protein
MGAHPGEVALQGGAGNDGEVGGLGQAGHCKVGLYPPAFIEEHGIDDPPGGTSIWAEEMRLRKAQASRPSIRILPKLVMSKEARSLRTAICSAFWLSNQFCRFQE